MQLMTSPFVMWSLQDLNPAKCWTRLWPLFSCIFSL